MTAVVELSEVDRLLLRAALLEGEPARAAYAELRGRFDLDALDYGRQRLLPLLHRNLTAFGVDDPQLGRLRGVRHYHWARNQVRVKALAPVLAALAAADIQTMLLKGAAILATCLDDMSLRPMDDIDLLVPDERRAAAVEVLVGLGYEPFNAPAWCIAEWMRQVPGYAFASAAGHQIDLHCHVLHLDQRPGADAAFWRRREPVDFAGARTAVLDPADQVLHAISHGALWNEVATLRWAADAALVLRRAGARFDWDQLVGEAVARELAPQVEAGLRALASHLDIAVPPAAMRTLARRAGPLGRREHRLRARAGRRLMRLDRLLLDLADFRRRAPGFLGRPFGAALAPYLRERFGARGGAALAALLAFAALGRPGWLRRLLRIDRWARAPDPAHLPALGAALDPAAAPDGFLDGWSHPERGGRWSNRAEARLAWRLPERWAGDLEVEVEGWPFGAPGATPPRVDFWANDRLVARWRADRRGEYRALARFAIPRDAVSGAGAVVLTLATSGLTSPLMAGASRDPRLLGFHLRRARLAPASAPAPGALRLWLAERFGADGLRGAAALAAFAALGRPHPLRRRLGIDRRARVADAAGAPPIGAAPRFLDGWSNPEPAGRWSIAREARLAWSLPADGRGDLECELDAVPLLLPGERAPSIDVFANDWRVARLGGAGAGGPAEAARLRIPAAALAGATTLILTLATGRPRSPADHGLSDDARRLAVLLKHVCVRRAE